MSDKHNGPQAQYPREEFLDDVLTTGQNREASVSMPSSGDCRHPLDACALHRNHVTHMSTISRSACSNDSNERPALDSRTHLLGAWPCSVVDVPNAIPQSLDCAFSSSFGQLKDHQPLLVPQHLLPT